MPRLFTLSWMIASRIQIQDVSPQVDCGRYPAKACLGDDGAGRGDDLPRRARRAPRGRAIPPVGTRRWREAPLEPIGNDRWEGAFAPDALGRWEVRVAGVGRPVRHLAGRVRRARWRRASVTWRASCRRARRCSATASPDDWRAAAPGLADGARQEAAKSKPLPLDVERPLARFGAWYELFPRSWGGFAGVAAVLPKLAALGFDVVYLPPVHPIGVTNRKGRNNAEMSVAGDVGKPLGNRRGRRRP